MAWLGGYKLMPVVGVLFLLLSFSFFINTLFVVERRGIVLLFALLFTATHFATAPSLPHDLYWMVSSFVYLYPAALTFLWLACYIRYIYVPDGKTSFGWFLATIIFLFCCIGLNEMFLVSNLLLLVLISYWSFNTSDRSKWQKTLPVLIAGYSCIAFFITSPGILERSAMEKNPGASWFYLPGIKQSFGDYFLTTFNMLRNGLLIAAGLLVVLYIDFLKPRYKLVEENLSRRRVVLFTLSLFVVSYLMTLAYYLPVQVESGYPSRIFNSSVILQQFAVLLLLPLLFFQNKSIYLLNRVSAWRNRVALVLVFFMGINIVFSKNNIRQLQHEYCTGQITRFDSIMQNRYSIINKAKESKACWQVATVDTVVLTNSIIYYAPDISRNRNPSYWNGAYEVYFRIDEVKRSGDSALKLW